MELNDLESMSSGIGTENTEAGTGETPSPLPSVQTAPVSGYDVIADLLPHEELKALNKWVQTYHLGGDDPLFGGYIMTKTTFSAAIAAGQAATLIHEDVSKLPDIIYRAVTSGAGDISGQVQAAVLANVTGLAQAIEGGIAKSTAPAVLAVQTALQDFDSKVDRTIIARKDAVIAQWVQSGSDALDAKIRTATARAQAISLGIAVFVGCTLFTVGAIVGMLLG
ncbi:hypothetical protein HF285_04735 [Acidithiobacillus ferrooxidans F221]|uniref:hypothetical protein n=1 Tax=Acidithiobacillus ferrooxidans TaxID=920 RepID=UPI001C069C23|nr:hypothetical protein [Acidithiobacillus ferrooxidans]MBU2807588.1 hypothetical protein [Acidithiobacillus ferrooxidans F221]